MKWITAAVFVVAALVAWSADDAFDARDAAVQREADYRGQVQQVIERCEIRSDGSALCPAGSWPVSK